MTETGVGAPRSGEERRHAPAPRCAPAGACTAGCARWYRDPRVTAAFQYTFREDDLFPTGLVTTDLTAPTRRSTSGRRGADARPEPTDPPPPNSCS